jgi:hypothetical protein
MVRLSAASGLGICLVVFLFQASPIRAGEVRLEHVQVTFDGIDEAYARAIARTVNAARRVCAAEFGYDMPAMIRVNISVKPTQKVRLFNDGVDTFSLSLRSEKDLQRPAASGVFQIYGLCHEVAHLAMYRPIKDHSWLSTAGAEGWAHYLGSVLVDEVHKREGDDLWPDRYDYRADGTRRLDDQLASPKVSEIAQAARQWRSLVRRVGAEKMPKAFSLWGQAKIDRADPAVALKDELAKVTTDAQVAAWWTDSAGLLLVKREASQFPKRQLAADKLTGAPRTLARDDGQSAGKSSLAGGGHAVKFTAQGASWYLTAVEIYGSRYGAATPPREDFHIWLCDEKLSAIADFAFPYSKFKRGEPAWVKLEITPTQVPQEFIVCVGFNPAATKGVLVHYDAKSEGHSLTGLPGDASRPFARGDWLIRAHVDQPKEADALSEVP